MTSFTLPRAPVPLLRTTVATLAVSPGSLSHPEEPVERVDGPNRGIGLRYTGSSSHPREGLTAKSNASPRIVGYWLASPVEPRDSMIWITSSR